MRRAEFNRFLHGCDSETAMEGQLLLGFAAMAPDIQNADDDSDRPACKLLDQRHNHAV